MRRPHSDAGRALDAAQLRTQRVYIDVEAGVAAALTRLRNFIEKHPAPVTLDGQREALATWLRGFKSERKAAGL